MAPRIQAITLLLVRVGCDGAHLTTHSALPGTQTAAMQCWAEYRTQASQHCSWVRGPRTRAPSGPAKSRWALKLQLAVAAGAVAVATRCIVRNSIAMRGIVPDMRSTACMMAAGRRLWLWWHRRGTF